MNNIDKVELLNFFSTPVPDSDILTLMLLLEADTSSSSSSSSDSDNEQTEKPKRQRSFTKTIDAFDDETFESQMKMKRITIEYLITRFTNSLISQKVTSVGRLKLSCKCKVYMYIWYLTNTVTYSELGKLFYVTTSIAWKSVREVASWLITISHEFINWPTVDAATHTCRKFDQANQIPGIIGVIGCTHICINASEINNKCYLNRNKNYSVILQAVVDADNKFIDINCGEPGSLNASSVLRRSDIFQKAETNYEQMFPNSSYILGNSTYFATNWLMPPFKDEDNLTPAQIKFNYLHSNALVVVKNTFDLLKDRFPRLSNFTEHKDLCAIINIIASACILHNICIIKNDSFKETRSSNSSDKYPIEETDIRTTNLRETLLKDLLGRKII